MIIGKLFLRTTLFAVVLIFCFTNARSQSGWIIQPIGSGAWLWDLSVSGSLSAFIAASGGIVYRTTNGGANWLAQLVIQGEDLLTIDFPSLTNGYTAGSSGKIFKSTNSGVNWIQINSPTTSSIATLYFLNDNTGFISTGSFTDGRIFKTTNGGNNWVEHGPGTVYPQILSINFPDQNTGYAAGVNGVVLKSTNAGVNWNVVSAGLGQINLFSVFFIDANTGFTAVPYPCEIIKTTNGGTSWNTVYNDTNHFPVSIFFSSRDTGYITGGALPDDCVVLKTINGGSVWSSEILNFNGHLNDVEFINNTTGYIVGEFGRVYKTTNGGTPVGINQNQSGVPEGFLLYQNYPNPFNPKTIINYQLSMFNYVILKVYDILGNEVATLIDENQPAGTYSVEWNASEHPSGIYFYELTGFTNQNSFSEKRKMVLLR